MRQAAQTFTRWVIRGMAAVVALLLVLQLWFFCWVVWYRFVDPRETAFMAMRLDELQEKNPKAVLKHQWVPYGQISIHLKRAIIAAEDGHFVDHEGFDWEGIQHAIEKNQKKGKVVAGGSTISQQLAKNLFLSGKRSYLRKAQEAVITVMIELVLDKERILELYLNVIEWGNGVFGAEAAARHYYGISAAQLRPEQAAKLAAMAPAPRLYDRNRGAPGLQRRTGVILGRMASAELP